MSTAHGLTSQFLAVTGARLHYEVRGSGPVLLMIPGGPADGGSFSGVAPLLSDTFTVVTYDPRGLSRSTLEDPTQDIMVEVQADDAHRLLLAVTSEPAYVLGSSGGAVTGLELVVQHPEQVHTLIAHEPPVIGLLPDHEALSRAKDAIYQTYLEAGVGPAMMQFMKLAGLNGGPNPGGDQPPAPPDPETAATMARMMGNLELFLAHMLRMITSYRPDTAVLSRAPTRVIIGCGTTSAGQLAHRTALALADRLGTPPIRFPGDHGGFATEPAAFVHTLQLALAGGG